MDDEKFDSETTRRQIKQIDAELVIKRDADGWCLDRDGILLYARTKRALLQSLEIQLRLEKPVYHVNSLPGDGSLRGGGQ